MRDRSGSDLFGEFFGDFPDRVRGDFWQPDVDVFETEPLPDGHPLWQMENVLITPHVAVADAADIPERRFALILENARRLLDGGEFVNVVDKTKWY